MGTGTGWGVIHVEEPMWAKSLTLSLLTLQHEGLSFIPPTMLCSHSVFPLVGLSGYRLYEDRGHSFVSSLREPVPSGHSRYPVLILIKFNKRN